MADSICIAGPVESLGDVILISTLARNLRLQIGPETKLTWITGFPYADALKNNPDISRVLLSEPRNLFDLWTKTSYDRFTQVHFVAMMNHEDTLWHHRLDRYPDYHLVDFYASRCGLLPLQDRRTFIYPDEKDRTKVDEVLAQFPRLKEDLVPIAMHITSPVPSKSWGVKNFSQLARTLEQHGCIILQVGAQSDEKLLTPYVVDLRGKLSIRQTAVAISKTLLYVGIDSGPAYLADSMGIPSIILYGATTPIQAGPLSSLSMPLEPRRMQEFPCGPGPLTCSTHCMIGAPCINGLEGNYVSSVVLTKLTEVVKQKYDALHSVPKEAVPA